MTKEKQEQENLLKQNFQAEYHFLIQHRMNLADSDIATDLDFHGI